MTTTNRTRIAKTPMTTCTSKSLTSLRAELNMFNLGSPSSSPPTNKNPEEATATMKNHFKFSATALLLVAVGVFAARVEANKVIEWNQLAQQHIAGPPFAQARQYAMVQIAVADAVVAIEGRYKPFRFADQAPRGASTDAAVAQAAHDVLALFLPAGSAGRTAIDDKLTADLAGIPPGQRQLGVTVGQERGRSDHRLACNRWFRERQSASTGIPVGALALAFAGYLDPHGHPPGPGAVLQAR